MTIGKRVIAAILFALLVIFLLAIPSLAEENAAVQALYEGTPVCFSFQKEPVRFTPVKGIDRVVLGKKSKEEFMGTWYARYHNLVIDPPYDVILWYGSDHAALLYFVMMNRTDGYCLASYGPTGSSSVVNTILVREIWNNAPLVKSGP